MSSTTQDLHNAISKELGSFIASKSSTFACGGRVPIFGVGTDDTSNALSSSPVALRWDSPEVSSGISKLIFPVDAFNDEHKAGLIKLVQDCQPASFGYKGEDIIDESYRKATKLDSSAFSSDFCPYKLGIIDTIAQVLLPNANSRLGTSGVKAELYKLNIYGAPSGLFKAHVDTPRSGTQFGSLVVSLPCHHKGGQLVVRHAGHVMTFDWGITGSNSGLGGIQWAAFYSDCEHEVLEVIEGYRITLTYNLYYSPGVGDLAGNSPAMDIKQLPLFNKVKAALDDPAFLAEGGHLGVYCQHAYAHSTEEGAKALPGVLKGADMAVYSVFKALGLKMSVRPIFDLGNFYDDDDDYYGSSDGEEEDDHSIKQTGSFILNSCGGVCVTEVGGGEESNEEILQAASGRWLKVNWLTDPSAFSEISFVHLTYGNEAGISQVYSHAALVVTVPATSVRQGVNLLNAAG
ncbi:hypothetical protein K491DRAFT_683553 [Lophiostoma macrostomum CBS 122681]|uniref:Fe2OG dioxygenase domain-containing protein n=1 Tax=Lophiostoma macrostomum CBS 122681 TaxID=1314788 RepID=A0A6A6SQ58_9PLEO|nr:hypothetical protein K491DRAFT_683553 [Lophiostoma macrostomum CBS 122681]